ncbi:SDR family oxidoreductase [Microvirga mediterraneensis]|uniref:SDR family oxidoreductase n=1 Tax=Microvirga mediterraneensis TaxID=2754695 RepID=A0A838BRF4_9HYPH|nr:SDR family oxidoreductase [Microvirga mediterraneensis]MBA1157552.1 SDR family oxidoreductase [Microvirga mediterraneensis]
MNLFVFGLGYSVRQFIDLYGGRFTEICGTVRSPEKARAMQAEGLQAYVFDGASYDPAILDRIARADALLVSIPPVGETDPVLAHFSHAITSAPRLRWIGYLSTVGVYGNADGNWVDETTPPNPASARSRQRIAAERAWLALGGSASFSVQIFRLAGIYGPGRNALEKVADGSAKRIVKPGQVFNRIHAADIAQVLMASIERPSRNAVYNVADDEPGPPQDVIAFAADLLGREPPPEVPFEEADQTPMARAFYADNKRVRNTRIKTELGVTLRYPTYREGLRALLESGDGIMENPDTRFEA